MTISNAFSTFNEACASPQEIIKMFMPKKHTHTHAQIFPIAKQFYVLPATPLKWCKNREGGLVCLIYIYVYIYSMCLIRNSVCFVLWPFLWPARIGQGIATFCSRLCLIQRPPPHTPHTPLHSLVPHYLLRSFLWPYSHSHFCGTFRSRPTWALCTLYAHCT